MANTSLNHINCIFPGFIAKRWIVNGNPVLQNKQYFYNDHIKTSGGFIDDLQTLSIMINKYSVLIGVLISLALMIIAISVYPGGSMFDRNSVGFNLKTNFISNLFKPDALNGAANPSRIWAYLGMMLLPFTYAIFFVHMSKKIQDRNAGYILKYGGIANILFTFLIVTPLHDLMLNISITLFWTCIVIVTVFILKTKLHLFKVLCVICLLVFYCSIYLWATNDWEWLPTMQKVNFIDSTLLILVLEYFTGREDFALIKTREQRTK